MKTNKKKIWIGCGILCIGNRSGTAPLLSHRLSERENDLCSGVAPKPS